MHLFNDHTSFHRAYLALTKRADEETDVHDLLQLGCELIFADRISLNGRENDDVKLYTNSILWNCVDAGLSQRDINTADEDDQEFADACDKAADSFAGILNYEDPDFLFDPGNISELTGTRPKLPPHQIKKEKDLHNLIVNSWKPSSNGS